jgi:hypothetical protein
MAWLRLKLSALIFFEDQNGVTANVTLARYVHMLQTFVVPQTNCLGGNCGEQWWQQDGVTAHTARARMEVLRQMFPMSFPVMVTFHGQQNPQILVHVTSFCGVVSKVKCTPAALTMSLC